MDIGMRWSLLLPPSIDQTPRPRGDLLATFPSQQTVSVQLLIGG
jgi:hypothetical protein